MQMPVFICTKQLHLHSWRILSNTTVTALLEYLGYCLCCMFFAVGYGNNNIRAGAPAGMKP